MPTQKIKIDEKFVRQVELLGFVLNKKKGTVTIQDLEIIFNVTHATIERDLNDLRRMGIDIHSNKTTGVILFSDIDNNLLKELINKYITCSSKYHSFEKATNHYVNEFQTHAISIITSLQRAINKNYIIKILYKTPKATKPIWVEVEPQILYETNDTWRLLALHNQQRKQYVLNRIFEVDITSKKFKPLTSDKITKIFSTSVEAWLSDKRFNAKIELTKEWYKKFKLPKMEIIDKIKKQKDGNVRIEVEVSSYEELARWICKTGGEVIAIKPKELVQIVIAFSKNTLNKHYLK